MLKIILIPIVFAIFSTRAAPVIDLSSPLYTSLVKGRDYTKALQKAAVDLPFKGGVILLPKGEVLIQTERWRIVNKSNFIIDGNGSTLRYKDGTGFGGEINAGLFLQGTRNYQVKNLTVDGNRQNRTFPKEPHKSPMHSIHIYGGENFNFSNVSVVNSVADGFYLVGINETDAATFPTNGEFVNCSSNNAFRQGMSIISGRNIRITGGFYSNTNGALPESGIDIESNKKKGVKGSSNIRIEGVTFHGNRGNGIQVVDVGRPHDILILGNNFKSEFGGALRLGGDNILVKDNTFVDFTGVSSPLSKSVIFSSGEGEIEITNNRFANVLKKSAIYIRGKGGKVTNNIFTNTYSAVNSWTDDSVISGNVIDHPLTTGIVLHGRNNTVSNNTVTNATQSPIWLRGGHHKIVNNTIVNDNPPNEYAWGICVERVPSRAADQGGHIISGNTIQSKKVERKQPAIRVYGIDNNVIEGNDVDSN